MKKILVIEDNKQFAERIADALILYGYIVSIASNGDRWQQSLFSYRPDLIISGIVRSGMNEFELSDLIRQDPRYFNLPFILMSDKDSEEDVVSGTNAGASIHLKKSCSSDELAHSVSQLLK
jgi:CheY-like chemotaxis protein